MSVAGLPQQSLVSGFACPVHLVLVACALILVRSCRHGKRLQSRGLEQGGGRPRLWREVSWHDWERCEGWSCSQQRDRHLHYSSTHPHVLPRGFRGEIEDAMARVGTASVAP